MRKVCLFKVREIMYLCREGINRKRVRLCERKLIEEDCRGGVECLKFAIEMRS